MNIEQLKKYPKAWERFLRFRIKKYSGGGTLHRNFAIDPLNNYELNGLLVEFFDEREIYLMIGMANNFGDEKRFTFSILLHNDWMLFALWYSSRQQAFDAGIEKCFELFEQQLTKGAG